MLIKVLVDTSTEELCKTLDQAIKIDPDAELAEVLDDENETELAITYAKKAIKQNPNNPEPYTALNEILLNELSRETKTKSESEELKKPLTNAYTSIKKAYQLSPENPEVLTGLILTLECMKILNKLPKTENIQEYYNQLEKTDTDGAYNEYIEFKLEQARN